MAVITISRQFGAGGITLGERLAERLGYRFVNEEMIKEVAARAKVTPEGVEAFEQSAGSKLVRFLEKIIRLDYLERVLSSSYGYLDEKRYVSVVREIITELYHEGNVVIIGRGGQYILAGKPDAYHLLLVAPREHRVQFIIDKYKVSRDTAERAVERADQRRQTFLSCFGHEDHDNPAYYHMSLNTALITLDKAEELVLKLIGEG